MRTSSLTYVHTNTIKSVVMIEGVGYKTPQHPCIKKKPYLFWKDEGKKYRGKISHDNGVQLPPGKCTLLDAPHTELLSKMFRCDHCQPFLNQSLCWCWGWGWDQKIALLSLSGDCSQDGGLSASSLGCWEFPPHQQAAAIWWHMSHIVC